MKSSNHEMVINTDSAAADNAREAGVPLDVTELLDEDYEYDREGNIVLKGSVSYNG